MSQREMALEFGTHNSFFIYYINSGSRHLHIVPYNSLILPHKLRESIANVNKELRLPVAALPSAGLRLWLRQY
jgi:hypothetical protein